MLPQRFLGMDYGQILDYFDEAQTAELVNGALLNQISAYRKQVFS